MTGVQFSSGAEILSPCNYVQTGSGVHPALYPICTRSFFPRGKVARTWSWPLTSI